jgi:hypothetical protein
MRAVKHHEKTYFLSILDKNRIKLHIVGKQKK